MLKVLNISPEDILHQVKVSCQIPNLLKAIATRKFIHHFAEKEGIQIQTEELQKMADRIRVANNLLTSEDTWAWLNKHNLTLENWEEIVTNNLLYNKLAMHLFAEKIEPFFDQNEMNYTKAITYEIILDDEDVALELFYSLQTGEIKFSEIARKYVQNPEIIRTGGYQGTRCLQDLIPEIATAIFTAQTPQIIKPIVTAKGVHLIWVEEIIKPILNEQLKTKILGDLFSNWLKQEIAKLDIAFPVADDQ